MSDTEKIKLIDDIMGWETFDDRDKVFYIKSFLLGWSSADDINKLTRADVREIARRIKYGK